MFWIVQSLIGIFSTLILPLLILCLIQYVICKYYCKFGLIIPALCFIYLILKEILYFKSAYTLSELNPNLIPYGFLLIIPYGSLLLGTTIVFLIFKRKKKKEF